MHKGGLKPDSFHFFPTSVEVSVSDGWPPIGLHVNEKDIRNELFHFRKWQTKITIILTNEPESAGIQLLLLNCLSKDKNYQSIDNWQFINKLLFDTYILFFSIRSQSKPLEFDSQRGRVIQIVSRSMLHIVQKHEARGGNNSPVVIRNAAFIIEKNTIGFLPSACPQITRWPIDHNISNGYETRCPSMLVHSVVYSVGQAVS